MRPLTAAEMMSRRLASSGPRDSNSALARIIVSRLLESWAIPPGSWPIASLLGARRGSPPRPGPPLPSRETPPCPPAGPPQRGGGRPDRPPVPPPPPLPPPPRRASAPPRHIVHLRDVARARRRLLEHVPVE